jgi:hypothetical protein
MASMRVTEPPSRTTTWAISTPTGPAPSTIRWRGTSVMPVTSRLVHSPGSPARPGTGGMTASAPVASTMFSAVYGVPSTVTRPGPSSRPLPRMMSMPRPVAHAT